jgi:hypothetical protein
MINSMKLITHVAPSTLVGRTREEGSREFRLRPAAKRISPKTGDRTSSTSKLTCLQSLAMKDSSSPLLAY